MGLVHGGVYASIAESITSNATGLAVWRDRGKIAMGNVESDELPAPDHRGDGPRPRPAPSPRRDDLDVGGGPHQTDGHLCAVVRMTIAVRDLPQTPSA